MAANETTSQEKKKKEREPKYLSLWIVGSEGGGAEFDDFCKLYDGRDGVLSGDSQLFLTRCGSSDQRLGVLDQSLGRLQNVFPVVRERFVVVFGVKSSCRGKHDRRVQVSDDSADGAGGVDASLSSP